MFTILYQFLVIHHRVSLPGIGSINLVRHPAQYDVAEKAFNPPSFTFELRPGDDYPSKLFFDWLSTKNGITEWEAIRMLNDFAFELNRDINSGKEIQWEHVGILKRDELSGNLVLDSSLLVPQSETPVHAEKVIRDHPQHTMRVGERERTSYEMEEILTHHEPVKEKRDAGWLIAIVVGVITFLFICYYFSQHGFQAKSTGNQAKVRAI